MDDDDFFEGYEEEFFDGLEQDKEKVLSEDLYASDGAVQIEKEKKSEKDEEEETVALPVLTMNEDEIDLHQVEMSDKALKRFKINKGTLICPPVGSGKTRMAIRFAVLAEDREYYGSLTLVACPLTIIPQWVEEIGILVSEGVAYAIYQGNGRRHRLDQILQSDVPARIVITTPETLRNDVEHLLKVKWTTLVIDEIHRAKNPDTKLHAALRRFPQAKIGLTATPCAGGRAEKELAALIDIVHPRSTVFSRGVEAMAKEYVITKTKEEMGIREIPVKINDVYVSFKDFEKAAYIAAKDEVDKAYEEYRKHLDRAANDYTYRFRQAFKQAKRRYVMSLQKLRIACSYCEMDAVMAKIKAVSENYSPIIYEAKRSGDPNVYKRIVADREEAFNEVYREAPITSKVQAVIDKAEELHTKFCQKVIVFCEFLIPLHVIAQQLKVPFSIITGSMSSKARMDSLRAWKLGETAILLASKMASGVGLNLAEASHAILLDTPWNPQVDEQAIGRMNRRTQTAEKLHIARIVVAGTFDCIRYSVHTTKEEQLRAALGKRQNEEDFISPIYATVKQFSDVYTKWEEIASTYAEEKEKRFHIRNYEEKLFGDELTKERAVQREARAAYLKEEKREAEEKGMTVEEYRIFRSKDEEKTRASVAAEELEKDEKEAARFNMSVREYRKQRMRLLSEEAAEKNMTIRNLVRQKNEEFRASKGKRSREEKGGDDDEGPQKKPRV
eukprot:gene2090-2283_t